MKYFDVELLKDAKDFVDSLSIKARNKIYYCIRLAQITRDAEIFQKLSGTEIWEFRILHKRIKYRLFSFWDANRKAFVICTHGVIKKTDKTPVKEIEKAENIRKKYNEYHGRSI
ncbi:MAG: type II toxin-antitoxin system RelE/ParE family toxin [Prolixibacteraceae bacterium]|nr:type II toxin-antitoxin system RelE/ParE family toxin [Prolixibacteraceae bacterium]